MLNIGGDKADKNYRYKMPPLQCKGEGRGNGVKIVVTNLTEVARKLRVIPQYPTKFFGIEFGAISSWDEKLERCVINGQPTAADLQARLDKFIDLFVLCPKCGLPEIKMTVKSKSGRIIIDCAACGHNGPLATQHKLVAYILAHPPPKTRGNVHAHGEQQQEEGAEAPEGGNPEGEDIGIEADIDVEATKATRRVKKSAAADEEDWAVDTSADAQKARKIEFFETSPEEAAKQQRIAEILSAATAAGTVDAPSTILAVFCASKERSVDEIVSETRRLQISRGLDDAQKVKIIIETFVDPSDPRTVPAQFEKQAALLKRFVTDRATAFQLIGCIEDFVGEVHPELLARAPLVLKAMYDADVLDEAALLAWHESPPEMSWLVKREVAAAVRVKATPFIDWLKEAEDEDEDEDEE